MLVGPDVREIHPQLRVRLRNAHALFGRLEGANEPLQLTPTRGPKVCLGKRDCVFAKRFESAVENTMSGNSPGCFSVIEPVLSDNRNA